MCLPSKGRSREGDIISKESGAMNGILEERRNEAKVPANGDAPTTVDIKRSSNNNVINNGDGNGPSPSLPEATDENRQDQHPHPQQQALVSMSSTSMQNTTDLAEKKDEKELLVPDGQQQQQQSHQEHPHDQSRPPSSLRGSPIAFSDWQGGRPLWPLLASPKTPVQASPLEMDERRQPSSWNDTRPRSSSRASNNGTGTGIGVGNSTDQNGHAPPRGTFFRLQPSPTNGVSSSTVWQIRVAFFESVCEPFLLPHSPSPCSFLCSLFVVDVQWPQRSPMQTDQPQEEAFSFTLFTQSFDTLSEPGNYIREMDHPNDSSVPPAKHNPPPPSSSPSSPPSPQNNKNENKSNDKKKMGHSRRKNVEPPRKIDLRLGGDGDNNMGDISPIKLDDAISSSKPQQRQQERQHDDHPQRKGSHYQAPPSHHDQRNPHRRLSSRQLFSSRQSPHNSSRHGSRHPAHRQDSVPVVAEFTPRQHFGRSPGGGGGGEVVADTSRTFRGQNRNIIHESHTSPHVGHHEYVGYNRTIGATTGRSPYDRPTSNPFFVLRSIRMAFDGFSYPLPSTKERDVCPVNLSPYTSVRHYTNEVSDDVPYVFR